jgi:Ohr subfamily peroxiredoxin
MPATMPVHVVYTARARSTGDGRRGRTTSDDGRIDLQLAHPPEFGGDGQGSNPEQLFAAGYAACFHSALRHQAREGRLDAGDSTVTAEVGIGTVEGDVGLGLTVVLTVDLPAVPAERRQELLDAAHRTCPYSRAVRGNIDVDLRLAGAGEGAAA